MDTFCWIDLILVAAVRQGVALGGEETSQEPKTFFETENIKIQENASPEALNVMVENQGLVPKKNTFAF